LFACFSILLDTLTIVQAIRRDNMDHNLQSGSTHEFVEKLQERQKKDQKNRENQGSDTPSKKLPNKTH
jgi:hypothetical protein